TLAPLESIFYPKAASVLATDVLSALATIEVIPATGPMILFVWGPQRVLPVRITSFSITEEAHDTVLNPIRAKVELSLTVLSYQDLPLFSPGNLLFLAHHTANQLIATPNTFTNLQSTGAQV